MFIAQSSAENYINLLTRQTLDFNEIRERRWYCPSCQQKVILKNGKHIRAHFAHLKRNDCGSFSEGETEEHLAGKALLAKWCEAAGLDYQLEAYLPDLKQRPDLLLPNKVAIEFQCSRLSLAVFLDRTATYLKNGYQVIWITGQKLWLGQRLKKLQRAMIYHTNKLGNYFWQLDVDAAQLTCLFHIEEHLLNNRIYYSNKSMAGRDNPLAFLLIPDKINEGQRGWVYQLKGMLHKLRQTIDFGLLRRHQQLLAIQGQLYQEGCNLKLLADEFLLPVSPSLLAKDSIIIWRFYFWRACQKLEGQSVTRLQSYFASILKAEGFTQLELPLIDRELALERFMKETLRLFSHYQRLTIIDERIYLLKVSALKKETAEWHHRVNELTDTTYHISTLPCEDVIRYSY